MKRHFKNIIKDILANLFFLRSIEISMRSKRYYKRNFGNLKFQGEYFQDMIAFCFLEKIKKGFYLDIGANDGISGSNTYIFEQIGWDGICIEPQPNVYKMLKKYRKCNSYNVALSSKKNDSVDFYKTTANALGGFGDDMSEEQKTRIENYGKFETIKVKTMTFDEIMNNYPNIKHIDFLSLDVEGHELSILKTINFQKYSFGFLTIEKNNSEKIKQIMKENNYNIFMERKSDIMFVPKEKM
jgi:FkbM family methyltransferase